MAATGLLGMNPFRKGVVVDMSSKPASLYVDLQQKERARQEALDKYFLEYDKNINQAGMRSWDIPDLTKLQHESKDFYFKNKEAIQNPMQDGGKAYTQWNAYINKQLALVSQSKQEMAAAKVYQKAHQDARNRGMVEDEDTFQMFTKSQKRVLDPEFIPFDVSRYNAYTPWNAVKHREEFYGKDGKNFTKENQQYFRINTPAGPRDMVTTTMELNPTEQNLRVLETLSAGRLAADYGFAKYVNEVKKNQPEYANINNVFRKIYNRDMVNDKDIALGITLSLAPSEPKTSEAKETSSQKMSRTLTIAQIRANMPDNFDAAKLIRNDYYGLNDISDQQKSVLSDYAKQNPIIANIPMSGLKDARGVIPSDLYNEYYSKTAGMGSTGPTMVLQDRDLNLYLIKEGYDGVKVVKKPYSTYLEDVRGARGGTTAVRKADREKEKQSAPPPSSQGTVKGGKVR